MPTRTRVPNRGPESSRIPNRRTGHTRPCDGVSLPKNPTLGEVVMHLVMRDERPVVEIATLAEINPITLYRWTEGSHELGRRNLDRLAALYGIRYLIPPAMMAEDKPTCPTCGKVW